MEDYLMSVRDFPYSYIRGGCPLLHPYAARLTYRTSVQFRVLWPCNMVLDNPKSHRHIAVPTRTGSYAINSKYISTELKMGMLEWATWRVSMVPWYRRQMVWWRQSARLRSDIQPHYYHWFLSVLRTAVRQFRVRVLHIYVQIHINYGGFSWAWHNDVIVWRFFCRCNQWFTLLSLHYYCFFVVFTLNRSFHPATTIHTVLGPNLQASPQGFVKACIKANTQAVLRYQVYFKAHARAFPEYTRTVEIFFGVPGACTYLPGRLWRPSIETFRRTGRPKVGGSDYLY